jgi:hypothetical protein
MLVFITATAQGGIMKNIYKQLVTTVLLATAALPGTLMAESASDDASPYSAAVNLDFEITIPSVLNFRVGSAGTGSIDLITFSPAAGVIGDDSDVPGAGGDLTGGVVTVELFSNIGPVTITPTNSSGGAGLSDGGTENIPYSEILTASNLPALPAPVLSNAGGTATLPTETAGVTDLSAQWTYTYDNSTVYPAGTYGGAGIQGGRVTYTAANP